MAIKNLERMDSYNPTNYVNNSEPDIDADNLNKTENKLEETVAKANEIIDALKALISTVQTNSDDTVPSSSLAYAMQQEITKNKEDIATANSNLAKTNAKVTLSGVKNINGFTAVYSDRTDRAFQLYYDNGEIASIAFNNTGIWYDFYDGRNWKQVWKFNKPS